MILNIMATYVMVNWNVYGIVILHVPNSYIVKNVEFSEYVLFDSIRRLL